MSDNSPLPPPAETPCATCGGFGSVMQPAIPGVTNAKPGRCPMCSKPASFSVTTTGYRPGETTRGPKISHSRMEDYLMDNATRFANIARVCHEANRAYCWTIGDDSQVAWDDAPEWQRASAINGVEKIAVGETKRPEDSHNSWYDEKAATGWVYGPVKDAEAKTHPCMVPFGDLPPEQQAKDHVFFTVAKALLDV